MNLRTCVPAALLLLASIPAAAQPTGIRALGQSTTISEPGHYQLTRNIRLNASGLTAFTITGDGVTLDLNGHQIQGPGGKLGTGIMIDGAKGVKVLNGTMAYLAFGVVVKDSRNVVLKHLRIRGQGLPVVALPPEVGIMIVQSRNVVAQDNAIYNTGLGIFVRGGQSWGNRIANNTLTAGTNGVIGICYNPADTDPAGPRGDLVDNNVITGFDIGVQMKETAVYNVIRGNSIAYITQALDLQNMTNQDVDNIGVQLP